MEKKKEKRKKGAECLLVCVVCQYVSAVSLHSKEVENTSLVRSGNCVAHSCLLAQINSEYIILGYWYTNGKLNDFTT